MIHSLAVGSIKSPSNILVFLIKYNYRLYEFNFLNVVTCSLLIDQAIWIKWLVQSPKKLIEYHSRLRLCAIVGSRRLTLFCIPLHSDKIDKLKPLSKLVTKV